MATAALDGPGQGETLRWMQEHGTVFLEAAGAVLPAARNPYNEEQGG